MGATWGEREGFPHRPRWWKQMVESFAKEVELLLETNLQRNPRQLLNLAS